MLFLRLTVSENYPKLSGLSHKREVDIMGSKKQRKTKSIKAKQKKKNLRIFYMSLILMISVGFLVFFFISLFDYVYPPTTGEGGSATKEKQKVQLYFADSNERFLAPELRYVLKKKKVHDQVAEITKALLDGPHTELVRTLPEGAALQSVEFKKDGTAYISFDRIFADRHPGGTTSELTTIYSLANTVCLNVPKVKSIKILIDNKELKTIKGNIDTRHPFFPNRDLIAKGSS
jgi:hypothetical protein